MQQLPPGFLEQIVEYRAFARCVWQIQAADSADARARLPRSPLMEIAKAIEQDRAQVDWDQARADLQAAQAALNAASPPAPPRKKRKKKR